MNRVSVTVHPIGHASPVGDFAWACFAAKEPRRFADFQGTVFGGTYAGASAWMSHQLPLARAFVVLFTRGDGMEEFLGGLSSEVLSVPMPTTYLFKEKVTPNSTLSAALRLWFPSSFLKFIGSKGFLATMKK